MNNLVLLTTGLIPIYENDLGKKLVSARELHEWLGSKQEFANWIKDRINQYGFTENVDFTTFDNFIKREGGNLGTIRKEYVITLGMAKELSMVERTEKGKQARQYFIKCEEKLKEQQKPACIEDVLIQSLQEMKDIKHQLNQVNRNALQANRKAEETKEEVQAIREVVEITPSKSWRGETNRLMTKICFKLKDYQRPKEEVYRALEERAGCNLKIRLENMRARQALNGASKSKLDNLNYLDVIAQDKKLIEIYTFIVSQMAIKQGITVKEG